MMGANNTARTARHGETMTATQDTEIPKISLYNGMFKMDLTLPEYHTRGCVSRRGVLHLHRPQALASVCGRQDVARAVRRDQLAIFSLVVVGARSVCPYCLAWAQGVTK